MALNNNPKFDLSCFDDAYNPDQDFSDSKKVPCQLSLILEEVWDADAKRNIRSEDEAKALLGRIHRQPLSGNKRKNRQPNVGTATHAHDTRFKRSRN